MVRLVEYSDSESDEEEEKSRLGPKKRKLSPTSLATDNSPSLPPLPDGFRDLYSSTVRTSIQDDPALHGGRRRATPHLPGNWPTHVYLEWIPDSAQSSLLLEVLKTVRESILDHHRSSHVHSLLQNDLGVALPLHISLSRPLVLQTEQRGMFLDKISAAIHQTGVREFIVEIEDMIWFSNEDLTRRFLVLRVRQPEQGELVRVLAACNETAMLFGLQLLYDDGNADSVEGIRRREHNSFHISIAWSLCVSVNDASDLEDNRLPAVPESVLKQLRAMRINFNMVKVRIGQDVMSIRLKEQRSSTKVEHGSR